MYRTACCATSVSMQNNTVNTEQIRPELLPSCPFSSTEASKGIIGLRCARMLSPESTNEFYNLRWGEIQTRVPSPHSQASVPSQLCPQTLHLQTESQPFSKGASGGHGEIPQDPAKPGWVLVDSSFQAKPSKEPIPLLQELGCHFLSTGCGHAWNSPDLTASWRVGICPFLNYALPLATWLPPGLITFTSLLLILSLHLTVSDHALFKTCPLPEPWWTVTRIPTGICIRDPVFSFWNAFSHFPMWWGSPV